MKKHPTQKELESKWWYRLLLVFYWSILVLTISLVSFQISILDGIFATVLNALIMRIIWNIIYFVIYGSKKDKISSDRDKISDKKDKNTSFKIF